MAVPCEDRDVRAALLAAAEAEIAERGVDNVSLRAIARRAGVSHQAPGHFFGNRAGLFTAVAADELTKMRMALADAIVATENRTARERLSAAGLAYIRFAGRHHELFALAQGGAMLDVHDESLVRERVLTWSVLANCVADAQAEGWRRDEPIEDVALMCWTIVHGTATAWIHGLLTLQFPDRTLEQIGQTIVDGL